MSHYRLYVFEPCRRGEHPECVAETRNDTCTCGCHAEIDDWSDE